MILDTSFLIDLLNGDAAAVAAAERIEETGATQRVPAQVVYELYVGVGYTDTPDDEVAAIRSVLDSRPLVDTTPEIARLAGRMNGRLKREGKTASTSDVLIGATARQFDEQVLTGNPDDFEPLPEVAVRTYR